MKCDGIASGQMAFISAKSFQCALYMLGIGAVRLADGDVVDATKVMRAGDDFQRTVARMHWIYSNAYRHHLWRKTSL